MARPPKIVDVLEKVRGAARTGAYRPSAHAIQRIKERDVDLTEVDYVLKNGHNCKKHDKWKTSFNVGPTEYVAKPLTEKESD